MLTGHATMASATRNTDGGSSPPSSEVAGTRSQAPDHCWRARNSTAKSTGPSGSTECSTSGGDALRLAHLDHDVGHRVRLGHEVKPAPMDPQSTPRSAGHSMGTAQCV